MKRLLALILAAALLLTLMGCTTPDNSGVTTPTETKPTPETTLPQLPTYQEGDNPVTFLSISLGENYENIRYVTVFANEDGTAHVEYVGEEKKVADMDSNIFHGIAQVLDQSGLAALQGQDVWSDGEANGSMYVDFADGTCLTANFSGEIPEAYRAGYAALDAFFQEFMASVPVYVPRPEVMGEVEPALLEEVTAILDGSGMANLDGFAISQVAQENYAFILGLSDASGVASAVSCSPMMMTTAYSLVIVTVAEEADAQDICADFEENLDWTKWVCVAPTNALIAVKGNMVLCLMAADQLYAQTASGVEAAGWTTVTLAENR